MVATMTWLTNTEYLCNKWQQICSVCHNHNPILSSWPGLTLEGEEVALWLLTSLCTSAKREVEVALWFYQVALLILTVKKHRYIFTTFSHIAKSEWDTLFFFYGIIMSVGGLGFMGYLSLASDFMVVYRNEDFRSLLYIHNNIFDSSVTTIGRTNQV